MDAEVKTRKNFDKYNTQLEPKPKYLMRGALAFLVGGLICTIGQFFFDLYKNFGFPEDEYKAYAIITMIFIGAFLTGIGVYDKIANYGGAGTLVPITGFANAMTSPSIEFKNEGIIFGTCVKMFTIAGPVIVLGVCSSMIIGFIYYVVNYCF